jgi:murein peptide amidase A
MNLTALSPAHRMARRPVAPIRRRLEPLTAPLDVLADQSSNLLSRSFGQFTSDRRAYQLPRYIYLGPKGGGDVVRLGIFAGIHGDEPEGAFAVARLIERLEQQRDLAQGYALFLYPVCNPTGFEDNTRHSRAGLDLNREFWKDSPAPEVRFLETEIWTHAFHGIVTLHSDDTSHGLYGFVDGDVLSENLLEPALKAAERFLPRNQEPLIDGFRAENGIIREGYHGVLRSVPGLPRPPFELTFETPQASASSLQVEAAAAALETILVEYRQLLAIAQDI